MKPQQLPDGPKTAANTTPVESETTDEFQPAYGRGGAVRSDEPERDWFFEDVAAALSTEKDAGSPETRQAPVASQPVASDDASE